MEINEETLQKLRCELCENYLSTPPIHLTSNGKSICGRCNTNDETTTRNIAYEELASTVLFPCIFRRYGCEELIATTKMKTHEDHCAFKRYICPVTTFDIRCSWMGTLDQLFGHYQETHPEFVAEHPYTGKPDVKRNSRESLLMPLYGFLFLVQVKCSVSSGKFWHCVRLIDGEELCDAFTYRLRMSNGETCVESCRKVMSNERFAFCEKDCKATVINSVFGMLGAYDDVNIQLSITMDKIECDKCRTVLSTAPILRTENGFCCNACVDFKNVTEKPSEEPCQFRGCSYASSNKFLLKKHARFLCKFSNFSRDQPNTSFLLHLFKNKGTVVEVVRFDGSDVVTCQGIREGILAQYAFIAYNVLFYLTFQKANNIIAIKLVTEEYGEKMFTCKYKISFRQDGDCNQFPSLAGMMQATTVDMLETYAFPYDWQTYIHLPSTILPNSRIDKCDFELTINKRIYV